MGEEAGLSLQQNKDKIFSNIQLQRFINASYRGDKIHQWVQLVIMGVLFNQWEGSLNQLAWLTFSPPAPFTLCLRDNFVPTYCHNIIHTQCHVGLSLPLNRIVDEPALTTFGKICNCMSGTGRGYSGLIVHCLKCRGFHVGWGIGAELKFILADIIDHLSKA